MEAHSTAVTTKAVTAAQCEGVKEAEDTGSHMDSKDTGSKDMGSKATLCSSSMEATEDSHKATHSKEDTDSHKEDTNSKEDTGNSKEGTRHSHKEDTRRSHKEVTRHSHKEDTRRSHRILQRMLNQDRQTSLRRQHTRDTKPNQLRDTVQTLTTQQPRLRHLRLLWANWPVSWLRSVELVFRQHLAVEVYLSLRQLIKLSMVSQTTGNNITRMPDDSFRFMICGSFRMICGSFHDSYAR